MNDNEKHNTACRALQLVLSDDNDRLAHARARMQICQCLSSILQGVRLLENRNLPVEDERYDFLHEIPQCRLDGLVGEEEPVHCEVALEDLLEVLQMYRT